MNKKAPTLHILQGLPGSGKSTLANELLKANRGKKIQILRLNRDSLRQMFDPGITWTPDFETIVRDMEVVMAKVLIDKGFNVIIDDTNLGDISQYNNFKRIDVRDFRDVPIETCLQRNEKRNIAGGNYCSPDIIVKLAKKFKLIGNELEMSEKKNED